MKKTISFLLLCTLAMYCLTACAEQSDTPKSAERKLRMTVDGQEVSIVLYDSPTSNALYEALPLELHFSDYNGTEKIASPPDALPTEGEPDGCDPETGDLCL